MFRLALCSLCIILLSSCGRSSVSTLQSDTITLSNGNKVDRFTLANDHISVALIPELGGKITSIKSRHGREYLSRSEKPYAMRRYGTAYSQTEFDGIDECFPSLAKSSYPTAPWSDRPIPDHGEICQLPWKLIKKSKDAITLEVHGKAFPYTFNRTMTIDGRQIILSYKVHNRSANPFYFYYAFHPLFAGEDGCRLEIPDDCKITLDLSAKNYLGEKGTTATWGSYLDKEGKLLKDNQFDSKSNNYYKYYTQKLKTGYVRLNYTDGFGLTMRWPSHLFPYLAVWCSQGAVGGLQHIAPEPTTSLHDALADAHKQKQTLLINGNSSISWEILLTVEEPIPEDPKAESDKPAAEPNAKTEKSEKTEEATAE